MTVDAVEVVSDAVVTEAVCETLDIEGTAVDDELDGGSTGLSIGSRFV